MNLQKKITLFNQDFKDLLKAGTWKTGILLSDQQIDFLTIHATELNKWNRKINLTAIKSPKDVAEKHFIDSIAVSSFITPDKLLIDLGTGGGFPAIPLKIIHPSLKIIMVDSVLKKVNFLKHMIRTLGLKDTDAVHARVEDLHDNDAYKNKFNVVISRGFAHLEKFTELAAPLLSENGTILSLKGKNAENEITNDIKAKFSVRIDTYILPFEKSKRYIISLAEL
jgi:16S rRNA (guanine527-N7)-methyltransferase